MALQKGRTVNSLVKRFERNTTGRDIAVGDIHGCFTKLLHELDAIDFDPTRDRLFSVGDMVDRGPESEKSLDWLEEPWFHAVQGNHEDMAIRFPNGNMSPGIYLANGGGWNLANTSDAQREFSETFKALPVAMEIETTDGLIGIVHADCPGNSWQQFTARLAMGGGIAGAAIDHAQWSRDRIDWKVDELIQDVRAVVVGHTPLEHHTVLGNVHYIDTMGWRGKRFTFLNLESLKPEPTKEAS